MTTKLKHYSIKENKPSDSSWVLIDAEDQTLGRLSSNIAMILMGKNKPNYIPNDLTGDTVVVINASKISVTGKKYFQKTYISHTMRPGSTKVKKFSDLIENNPEFIIMKCVKGMLPKNKLAARMLKRLKVYAGNEHPHEAQLKNSNKSDNKKEVNSDN
ncbi:MAG: 50S ribosomal protein L13 [Dehalococcoidales bacterium]|jgi:large subunit ribosomal protein L13|nr:50S ribosomal protein L13 [Dehalococcoidia bacterium]NCG35839.1 50S ribosomal protein L13 [Dehalococcoidales bacterium]